MNPTLYLGGAPHKTFGDIVSADVALLGQYHVCRAAQLTKPATN